MRKGLLTTVIAVLTDPRRKFPLGLSADAQIKALRLSRCAHIDKEIGSRKTEDQMRYYAHWGCKPHTICAAHDITKLPLANQLGVILHEIGHACCGHAGEPQADLWILERFKIKIEYTGGIELQSVNAATVRLFEEEGNGR
jgi:hypothetical protein